MFTADDSRRGTRGQLVGGTVEVQVTDDLLTFSARDAWGALLGGEGSPESISARERRRK
jgi:hypothetical protein